MQSYVIDMINTFPEKIIKTTVTTYSAHLFQVMSYCEKLDHKNQVYIIQ